MSKIIYLFAGRLPTEKANGVQVIKTCEAWAKLNELELIYPIKKQPNPDLNISPLKYYSIATPFKLTPIKVFDFLHYIERIHQKLAPLGSKINAWWTSQAIIKKAKIYFSNPQTVFYSRSDLLVRLLVKNRKQIKGKIVLEVHSYSEKQSPKIILQAEKIDSLVTITHNLKRIFIENGFPAHKIMVSPDAVDLEHYKIKKDKRKIREQIAIPQDAFVIGYVGRFHTLGMEKGIPELIKAVDVLNKEYNERVVLLCVGGPMDRVAKYQDQIRQLGGDPSQFIFKDKVPNIEVPHYINACDCVTIPWPWNDFSAYYTSPMKLFEYLASGVPIVASKLPSLEEVLTHGKNALLHIPEDPNSMAHCFQTLKINTTLSQSISRQALCDIQKYTWDERAKNIDLEINKQINKI